MTNPVPLRDIHWPLPNFKPEVEQTCEEAGRRLIDFITRHDGMWIGTMWQCLGCGGQSYLSAPQTPYIRLVPWTMGQN